MEYGKLGCKGWASSPLSIGQVWVSEKYCLTKQLNFGNITIMTKQEYNRDVKRLRKAVDGLGATTDEMWEYIDKTLKAEFIRLYDADRTFEYANKESVLTMLRINLRFRFIPLHSFGLWINI